MNSKLDPLTEKQLRQEGTSQNNNQSNFAPEVVQRRITRTANKSPSKIEQFGGKAASEVDYHHSMKRKQNAEVKIKFLESSKAFEGASEKILQPKLMSEDHCIKVEFEFADFHTGNFN